MASSPVGWAEPSDANASGGVPTIAWNGGHAIDRATDGFAHPTILALAPPDQDQPDHSQRRAVIRPLHLADHEARLRPRDDAGALADPEQADQQREDSGNPHS